MEKAEFLKMMEKEWDKIEKLQSIKGLYNLEKEADTVFTELNRAVLNAITQGKGKDRRGKKNSEPNGEK